MMRFLSGIRWAIGFVFRPPVVRVWRLGSLEHALYPSQEAIDRLARYILAAKPGDDLDIVWGPGLDVLELRGTGEVNIVTGPGIRVTRGGHVIKFEQEGGQ